MKHFAPTFPAEFWIVADLSELEQGRICLTEDDIHERIEEFTDRGERWCVMRVGAGEIGRDVTLDFLPDETEADDCAGIPSNAELLREFHSKVM